VCGAEATRPDLADVVLDDPHTRARIVLETEPDPGVRAQLLELLPQGACWIPRSQLRCQARDGKHWRLTATGFPLEVLTDRHCGT
jgi:hypothetical protein